MVSVIFSLFYMGLPSIISTYLCIILSIFYHMLSGRSDLQYFLASMYCFYAAFFVLYTNFYVNWPVFCCLQNVLSFSVSFFLYKSWRSNKLLGAFSYIVAVPETDGSSNRWYWERFWGEKTHRLIYRWQTFALFVYCVFFEKWCAANNGLEFNLV